MAHLNDTPQAGNLPDLARPGRLKAIVQALFVTFLWSTSWVLIKIGLWADLPPLTFAGLRYTLAFLCLLPFILINANHRHAVRALPRHVWRQLALLGVVYYGLTQGAQFVSLAFLPAATVNMLLNLSPVAVAVAAGWLNRESPAFLQWGGILLTVIGTLIFFLPLTISTGQTVGLVIALVGMLANAGASLLGRQVNRGGTLSPLLVTTISMGVGGGLLLLVGGIIQGFGDITRDQWLIIGWLAVVNTAAAFTLWNRTLRTLTALESSVINNTMLPQIALLAWVFLDETLTIRQVAGLVIVAAGTLVVQMRPRWLSGLGKAAGP